jgi:glycerol kinase
MDFLFKPGGGGDANEKKEKISSKNDMKIDFDEKIWKEDHPADLVGALDQGTSSTRFVVYTRKGLALASAQVEHAQIYPPGEVGWHEHDPIVLAENSLACICAVQQVMKQKGVKVNNQGCLQAIGITNQRETTIAWNRETGVP